MQELGTPQSHGLADLAHKHWGFSGRASSGGGAPQQPLWRVMLNSTRRFAARSTADRLRVIGVSAPQPRGARRSRGTPRRTSSAMVWAATRSVRRRAASWSRPSSVWASMLRGWRTCPPRCARWMRVAWSASSRQTDVRHGKQTFVNATLSTEVPSPSWPSPFSPIAFTAVPRRTSVYWFPAASRYHKL